MVTTRYLHKNYILEFRENEIAFIILVSRRVGQDRNCHRKSCLLIVGHCYYRFQALTKYILFNAR